MPDAAAILARLDEFAAELARFRAEIAALIPPPDGNGLDAADDFVEISYASERWNRPSDTLRLWCRQGDGKKVGGRWLVSSSRVKRRLAID